MAANTEMGSVILDHWDMWSSRNADGTFVDIATILDHWDMWSSRNVALAKVVAQLILDHWDMWSSRNADRNLHA